MAAVRQAIPQLEARRIADIPNDAWRAAFPLPYELNLRSAAAHNQLDPMLVAGLIRQESAFESKAMSRAGAIGLMQVEPKTASKLARQLKVRYARDAADRSGLQFAAWFALPGQSDPGLRNAGGGAGCLQCRRGSRGAVDGGPELSRDGGVCGIHSVHRDKGVRADRDSQLGCLPRQCMARLLPEISSRRASRRAAR